MPIPQHGSLSRSGIDKDDRDYEKVQRQVLTLRRVGRLAYSDIADATRWMRKPTTHDGAGAALRDTARFYRKALWRDAAEVVEVWCSATTASRSTLLRPNPTMSKPAAGPRN